MADYNRFLHDRPEPPVEKDISAGEVVVEQIDALTRLLETETAIEQAAKDYRERR